MINETKQALAEQIADFSKGVALVSSSISYYNDDDRSRGQLLECIINGEFDEYVQDRYVQCFSRSFDDESAQLSLFSEAFSEYAAYKGEATNRLAVNEYEACVLGFAIAHQSLAGIVAICKEHRELKREMVQFNPQSVDETFGSYNPFCLYGVIEFDKKFRGFRRAYLAELKKQLGVKEFTLTENRTQLLRKEPAHFYIH